MTESKQSESGRSGEAPEATLISVILDRSGSMAALRLATIAGFNQFMREQRKQDNGGRALVSLTQFNHEFQVNFVGEPIENLPQLDEESYIPDGNTALHDAIGRTINELEMWTKGRDWKERVLVMIITDGQENSSREYSFPQIQAMIQKKEQDGWNFVYMGANQDAYAVGGAMNVRAGHAANWDASDTGVVMAYARAARSTVDYRAQPKKGLDVKQFFNPTEDPSSAPPAGKLVPKGDGTRAKR